MVCLLGAPHSTKHSDCHAAKRVAFGSVAQGSALGPMPGSLIRFCCQLPRHPFLPLCRLLTPQRVLSPAENEFQHSPFISPLACGPTVIFWEPFADPPNNRNGKLSRLLSTPRSTTPVWHQRMYCARGDERGTSRLSWPKRDTVLLENMPRPLIPG
jgi:hypothetical protein